MHDDKRIAPRFLFSEPVEFTQSEIIVNGSLAGNISASGMSLRVQEFVPMGVVLELQLRLGHGTRVIWAKAQVVRVREVLSEDCYEIGLKFIEDKEYMKAIGEYIESCRSNQQESKGVS